MPHLRPLRLTRIRVRLASTAPPMTPHELLLSLTQPSAVLESRHLPVVQALCGCSKRFLRSLADKFIRSRSRESIVISTSIDGTPLTTKERWSIGEGSTKVIRSGGSCHEFLVIRSFLFDLEGNNKALFSEPICLSGGKTSWCLWSASRNFCGNAREHGHMGLVVSHYCYDRGIFSSMSVLMKKTHRLVAENMLAAGFEDPADNIIGLLELVATTPCACHDAHNALRWAVRGMTDADDMINKSLFICISSLRNAYHLLIQEIGGWLMTAVVFDDQGMPEAGAVWSSLGVSGQWLDELVALKLYWAGGRLHISQEHMEDENITERITSPLLHLWRFQRFTDSRWLALGDACRSILKATLSGIDGLVAYIRAAPHFSDWHIHGWERMQPSLRFFVAVTGLSSYIPDAFLAAVLEDDRVVQNLAELEAAVEQEVEFVSGLGHGIWQVLAEAVSSTTLALQSRTIEASHIVAAFLSSRVFKPARAPLWHLCLGDRRAQLNRLGESAEPPTESTTWKIWRLLRLGYSVERLLEALELMNKLSWSATVTEQGHAQASSLRKLHVSYSAETLVTRSMLGAMRPLMAPTKSDQRLVRMQQRLASLARYRPSHIGARQAYLKDLVETSSLMKKRGRQMSATVQKTHLEKTWRDVARQSANAKKRYSYLAAMLREERSQKNLGEMQHLRDAMVLQKDRAKTEAEQSGGLVWISDCKLEAHEVAEFDAMYESDTSAVAVRLSRAEAIVPPLPPSEAMQEALHACADAQVEPTPRRPSWWAAACEARDLLGGTVWRFMYEGEAVYLKYAYGSKNPQHICFQKLSYVPREVPAKVPGSDWEMEGLTVWEHSFAIEPMRFLILRDPLCWRAAGPVRVACPPLSPRFETRSSDFKCGLRAPFVSVAHSGGKHHSDRWSCPLPSGARAMVVGPILEV